MSVTKTITAIDIEDITHEDIEAWLVHHKESNGLGMVDITLWSIGKRPEWSATKDGVGSGAMTYRELCEWAGITPEQLKKKRIAELKKELAELES